MRGILSSIICDLLTLLGLIDTSQLYVSNLVFPTHRLVVVVESVRSGCRAERIHIHELLCVIVPLPSALSVVIRHTVTRVAAELEACNNRTVLSGKGLKNGLRQANKDETRPD